MITSKTNPKIKNIIKLEKASERREQNRILIEGRREIERAVACGFEVDTLFVCPEIAREGAGITARSIEEVSLDVFEKIAYREGSDGLLAVAIPKYADLKTFKPKKNPLSEWDPTTLKKDIGFGFRVVVPMLGIIGFDFAWPLDPGEAYNGTTYPKVGDMEFNFVIGQAF